MLAGQGMYIALREERACGDSVRESGARFSNEVEGTDKQPVKGGSLDISHTHDARFPALQVR